MKQMPPIQGDPRRACVHGPWRGGQGMKMRALTTPGVAFPMDLGAGVQMG